MDYTRPPLCYLSAPMIPLALMGGFLDADSIDNNY